MKKFIYVLVVVVLVVLGVMFFGGSNSGTEEGASVSMITLKSVSNAASPLLANSKVISWEANDYPAEAGVNINLIKKVSDSPVKYEVVRNIATDTPNDGEETWTPKAGETGDNFYIEVTCSSTFTFTGGCQVNGGVMKVNQ